MLSAALLLAALTTPAFVSDALEQARALIAQGQLSQASELLDAALAEGSGDERSLRLALADALRQQGDSAGALQALSPLPADDDHDVALALGRTWDLAIDERYAQGAPQPEIDAAFDAAQTHLERAFALRSDDDSSSVWELGKFYLYRNKWVRDAIDLANEALEATPDDGEALLLRGAASAFTYWEAKQNDNVDVAAEIWQRAVDDLTQANELLPEERIEPLGQLVWFYEVQEGLADKAVDAAREIADRSAEPDLSLLYRLAIKYRQAMQLQAAGRAVEKIVEISARQLTEMIRAETDPTAAARLLTGSIDAFYKRGDRAACRSILSAIVAADPQDQWVWDTYAVICTETSRFDDAITAYERAIEIDPENPRTYNDLGAVYQHFLQRETDKARELYEKCIALADEQLALADTTPEIRQRAADAKTVAQGNLNSLRPAGGGLLDSMMAGLRGLSLPAAGSAEAADDDGGSAAADADADGDGDDGDADGDNGDDDDDDGGQDDDDGSPR